jgi:hypothetical protein
MDNSKAILLNQLVIMEALLSINTDPMIIKNLMDQVEFTKELIKSK